MQEFSLAFIVVYRVLNRSFIAFSWDMDVSHSNAFVRQGLSYWAGAAVKIFPLGCFFVRF